MLKEHAIAVLYFIEEALGYRQSLHWLRRYLETDSADCLRGLIKEVCRENFLHDDLWQKVDMATIDEARGWIGKPSLLDLVNGFDDFSEIVGNYFQNKDQVISRLQRAITRSPEVNWIDALSRNQIRSKIWLIEQVKKQGWFDAEEIVMVGGWIGMIPFLASNLGLRLNDIINIDMDQKCHAAALVLNRRLHGSFINVGEDVRSLDFSQKSNALIIDTIVEHFENHGDWLKTLPKGTRVVLQSNDMFGLPDHVNCHNNLEEFVDDCDLAEISWQGQLEQIGCTRYMILGRI